MGTEAVSAYLIFILTAVVAILLPKNTIVVMTAVTVIILLVKQELFKVSWKRILEFAFDL